MMNETSWPLRAAWKNGRRNSGKFRMPSGAMPNRVGKHRSSKLLMDVLERPGSEWIAGRGMPTAFVALEPGSGQPTIGFLGEFDALPMLSQKAAFLKRTRSSGAPGHGCSHNTMGTVQALT